eukprot:8919-Eustigmatos_ZCMA.PRE.1
MDPVQPRTLQVNGLGILDPASLCPAVEISGMARRSLKHSRYTLHHMFRPEAKVSPNEAVTAQPSKCQSRMS